ncbi:hypothetical protein [Nitratifractor salsuginis]|uniref:Uncharacterized protein n=1 Tax=Nitratifractor salsuginis (strain DSM 16511 / JCM 12458 / E9I37-1) TaxID=749222 RepID=E6X058_NITSE|nr:hypothetical protein [Nitratifractor salsuginis]ADV46781.1 hypothetical protein Nitsa_1533 [Nitratifractor salsuginis DSM 16511]
MNLIERLSLKFLKDFVRGVMSRCGIGDSDRHWVIHLFDYLSKALVIYFATLFLILFLLFEGIQLPITGYEPAVFAIGYFLFRVMADLSRKKS